MARNSSLRTAASTATIVDIQNAVNKQETVVFFIFIMAGRRCVSAGDLFLDSLVIARRHDEAIQEVSLFSGLTPSNLRFASFLAMTQSDVIAETSLSH